MRNAYTKCKLGRLLGATPFVILVCALLGTGGQAHGAGLLVADGGLGGVLQIEQHEVRTVINNGIAVTEVTQVFRNTEDRQVEALYTFPVPKGASVANFSMWIGGKEMIGEVVEKQRARQIYESYKQTRRDPGLLEQTSYKTFEMRVFPIGPRAQQKVKICYYQELDADHDWVTYVYPLATVATAGAGSRTTGKFSLDIQVKSEVPVVSMESPSHGEALVAARHAASYWQASLETSAGDLNRDVVLAYKLSRPKTGLDLIASKQAGEDGYFCLSMTAGEEMKAPAEGMDYVFILDISGSMADDGKLSLSRSSASAFIEALGPADRFEVITFNVQPNALFRKLRPVDEAARKDAAAFLATQQARGGTVLRPALTAAYRYGDPDRRLNVVILSDGMTEQTERAALVRLIGAGPANSRIFCIGVGNEINRPLLRRLAEGAGGLAAFLSQGDDFQRQAKAFRRKLTHPVATNVRFRFDGVQVYDMEPREVPNLYHGTPVRLCGRYRGSGQAQVTVEAEVNGSPLKQTVKLDLPALDAANPEIERMWAWHKVQRLLEAAGDGQGQAVEEIVRLGEGYSIATEYTSFIVLENDGEYQRWRIQRRNALRIARDRRSREATLAKLEALRTKAFALAAGPEAAPAQPAPAGGPQAQSPQPPQPQGPRSRDINFGRDDRRGGGGPVGVLVPLLVGALAAGQVRRKSRGGRCRK